MTTKPMTIQGKIPARIQVIDETGREVGHADVTDSHGRAIIAIITVTDPTAADMLQREPRPDFSVGYSVKIETIPETLDRVSSVRCVPAAADGTSREASDRCTAPARTWRRRLAVASLSVPMALLHWPRLIVRDLADGFRDGFQVRR